jgi:hypothetical protein
MEIDSNVWAKFSDDIWIRAVVISLEQEQVVKSTKVNCKFFLQIQDEKGFPTSKQEFLIGSYLSDDSTEFSNIKLRNSSDDESPQTI